jgi:hypothetical protein
MLAIGGAPGSGRRLDQRDDTRLLVRAAAKGGGVCQRDTRTAWCGVGRVVAGRAGSAQALVMIAGEVLVGWGLLKEWRQELVAANV